MKLGDGEKFQVILKQLEERYSSARAIRERSERLTVWVVGLAFALLGFLLFEKAGLLPAQRSWAIGVVSGIAVLVFWQQAALNRGFKMNRMCIVKLEAALGAFEPGAYVEKDTLLPGEYRKIDRLGAGGLFSGHFLLTYVWMLVVLACLIALIAATPIPVVSGPGRSTGPGDTQGTPPSAIQRAVQNYIQQ